MPNATFRINGKGSRSEWERSSTVQLLGLLGDLAKKRGWWAARFVPVHIGRGARVKIAEAFARGMPVVSTALEPGVCGNAIMAGRQAFMADRPEEIARTCLGLHRDPEAKSSMIEKAKKSYGCEPSREAINSAVKRASESVFDSSRDHEQSLGSVG